MGQRLLLVDSDRRFIQDHQVALESSFDVDYLYAAEGVIEALESGRYGAVLICVEIADNKGYAICSAIRRLPALAEIKIALISAKATEEEYSRHKTLRGHADLYLHKPIASASLVAELGQLVPLRTVDPDNPLGDLTGTDLGEEWLDSLRAEVEAEAKAEPPKVPEPSVSSARVAPTAPPAASRPMPAIALPSVILPVDVPKEAGRLELMESRIKDLEQKLRLQEELLEARERELAELPVVQDRATRNLEEALQC
ncbi:MAG: response regulator, partial [Firmicutes bacterium]|nr:response regulator [Bacillota bacterium]